MTNNLDLTPERLQAFSDGVLAIIITIAVLGIRVPEDANFSSLITLAPLFAVYAVSFQSIGTYWINHHHLFKATTVISNTIIWSNLLLLFWLSLLPFSTEWLGTHLGERVPSVWYAAVSLFSALSYSILTARIAKKHGPRARISRFISADQKGIISMSMNALAFILAFFVPWISYLFIVGVAALWFIPGKLVLPTSSST